MKKSIFFARDAWVALSQPRTYIADVEDINPVEYESSTGVALLTVREFGDGEIGGRRCGRNTAHAKQI